METACSWMCDTLDAQGAFPLQVIYERHTDHSDSFDLSEVLSFLPEKDLPNLVKLIEQRLSQTFSYLKSCCENESEISNEHRVTVRAASEIAWLLMEQRKTALPILRSLIFALHDAFLDLPTDSHDRVSILCERLWRAGDDERNRVVPCTMLYLLQRSFGEESGWRCGQSRGRLPGTTFDIRRVYSMRKSLETLELVETSPQAETIRHLLMRCATSSVYLKTTEGRKFLAYLLTLDDVKASTFDALTNQLGTVRKSSANLFGMVFLYAWKSRREDWLAERLMYLSEKAIQAGSEPFSSNLRVVLSTFHANKRVTGVDLLLNGIYSPVLFRNLMVANPLVRRNAVIVMSDAFPIHDPGAGVQEIEKKIEFQCIKLLDLLQDPCSIVRLAAIEGSCRILGLFWELVSSTYAKQVIDLLTCKMAFDASSPRIRVTVFEGLKFLVENHLSHQVLAIALRRVGHLVHDRVEKVRLSFLDLLLAVKGKRIRSLRYFDVVDINDLLLRLPTESPAVASKIMELIRTSYFPLERKQKSVDELAESQTRACLSLLHTNREAARHFYKHLYLHVAPGPILEFAMRLSYIALEGSDPSVAVPVKSRKPRRKGSHPQEGDRVVTKPPKVITFVGDKENVPPPDNLQGNSSDREDCSRSPTKNSVGQESIFVTVAEVVVSISASLRKEANKELQAYLESIFGGQALNYYLLEKRNSLSTRAACWRIASCLSVSQIQPLIPLWEQQMGSVSELHTRRSSELQGHRDLVSALILCGLKWNLSSSLTSFLASWCDAAVNGNRAAGMGIKASKRKNRRKETNSNDPEYALNAKHDISTRARFLFSLWICGDVILTSEDLNEEISRSATSLHADQGNHDTFCVLAPLRRACIGVLDFFLETYPMSRERTDIDGLLSPRFLLRMLTTTWRLCLKFATYGVGVQSLKEMRHLTQFFSSSHLWKSASAISDQFVAALANTCLAHCADAVAVTNLANDDLVEYEVILRYIQAEIVFSNTPESDHVVAEAIRLSFLLREQAFDTDAWNLEGDLGRSVKLRKTSNTLLSMVCDILSDSKLDSNRSGITLSKMSRHEKFLHDVILDMIHAEDMEDFRLVLSKSLIAGFESESVAEGGMFSRFMCRIVASQIISKAKGGPNLGFKVYASIVRCLRCLDDRAAADQCIGNFTKILAECVSAYYDENDHQLKPNDNARECFAKMDSLLHKEFPQLSMAGDPEDNEHLAIREGQKVISLLRNMGEQDVLENNRETMSIE